MRRRERGFTLIEVLFAVTLLGIVAVAVGAIFMVTVRTTGETSDRFTDSVGPKFLSVYLVPDVQSAKTVDPNTGACGGSGAVISFLRYDPDDASGAATGTASYFVETTGSRRVLVRRYCTGDLASPTETNTVVQRVAPTGGVAVACDAGACVTDSTPRSIAMTVTAPPSSYGGQGYTYTVSAVRQAS
jgi:prepilin-type N-terminal cleavage/methylation domain-containing protein